MRWLGWRLVDNDVHWSNVTSKSFPLNDIVGWLIIQDVTYGNQMNIVTLSPFDCCSEGVIMQFAFGQWSNAERSFVSTFQTVLTLRLWIIIIEYKTLIFMVFIYI